MQLFTLINTLLNHESEAFGRNLHLLPYEVIPLSPSAGLVSWVPNTQQCVVSALGCSTAVLIWRCRLQSMISSNREKDKSSDLTNKEVASLLGVSRTFTRTGRLLRPLSMTLRLSSATDLDSIRSRRWIGMTNYLRISRPSASRLLLLIQTGVSNPTSIVIQLTRHS